MGRMNLTPNLRTLRAELTTKAGRRTLRTGDSQSLFGAGLQRESRMTTGGAPAATRHGVTRTLVALLAAEAFYRVAIRSHVRQAIGVGS